MIRGMHHVSMTTPNLKRLLNFYVGLLGFEVAYEGTWEKDTNADTIMGLKDTGGNYAFIRLGNLYIEMFEFATHEGRGGKAAQPCDRGFTHVCLDVDDMRKEYARLTAAGMKFISTPVESPIALDAYGLDPDGNIVELMEMKETDVPFHSKYLRRLRTDPLATE